MTFDSTWEKVHAEREWGKYPPEEVVRFLVRNFGAAADKRALKILDLGCGAGAIPWLIAREGFSAYGIDGSPSAIARAKQRLAEEGLSAELAVGDFSQLPYPDASFAAVIDNASIQHNSSEDIRRTISEVRRVLVPGGRFFGMMLAENKGFFEWSGVVHCFTLEELQELFYGFASLVIERVTRTGKGREAEISFWIVEAAK